MNKNPLKKLSRVVEKAVRHELEKMAKEGAEQLRVEIRDKVFLVVLPAGQAPDGLAFLNYDIPEPLKTKLAGKSAFLLWPARNK